MRQANTDLDNDLDQQQMMYYSAAPGMGRGMGRGIWQLLEEDVWDDWTEQTPGDIDRHVQYVWGGRCTSETGDCGAVEKPAAGGTGPPADRKDQQVEHDRPRHGDIVTAPIVGVTATGRGNVVTFRLHLLRPLPHSMSSPIARPTRFLHRMLLRGVSTDTHQPGTTRVG
jgi:hypothetical protein